MADDNVAQDLASMWAQNEARFKESRDLITECARWARQEIKPSLPTRMVEGRNVPQGFPVTLPHATTMPQDVASFIARRQPSLKRTPLGQGSRAERDASKIEQWLQEAFASKIKIDGNPLWETLVAFGTADAEYAVLTQPAPSHYAGFLELKDDEGNITARWQRNSQNESYDDYRAKHPKAEYKLNEGKSAAAHGAYLTDWKARRRPFVVRVLSAAEYLPLGRNPLTGQLDTLLIRSTCSASHLETQGFSWWTHDGRPPNTNGSSSNGTGDTYTLYELHTGNPWRTVYQIVGMHGEHYTATKDGQPAQHGTVWTERWPSLVRLPAGQFWGWHRANEKDPAKRGIPLLAPFKGILGAANRSITGIVEHNYRTGYGGWGVELDKELYQVWVEMGRPKQFDLQDDAIHVLLGRPTSLVHAGVGADAWRILEFLAGLVEKFNEGDRVRSSPDASSIAQTTSMASVDTTLGMISTGALAAYQFVAECLLEQCAALSEESGDSIPVYCTIDKDGEERTHVELGTSELAGDFTVEVEQPTKKGTNLPKAQAGVSWVDQGLIGKYEWREDFYGDPQPEQALDRIAAEQYVDSDQGQQLLGELVERLKGDRQALRIRGLISEGQMTMGMTPTAAMPPRPGGPAGQPQPMQPTASGVGPNGVPLPQQPNPAASALGGMTAAAVNPGVQSQVVAATGVGAETAMP